MTAPGRNRLRDAYCVTFFGDWEEPSGESRPKRRGLTVSPELAIGDGALGFWKALRQVYGQAREQRCWVHKTASLLNKPPKSVQSKAKGHLQGI